MLKSYQEGGWCPPQFLCQPQANWGFDFGWAGFGGPGLDNCTFALKCLLLSFQLTDIHRNGAVERCVQSLYI